MKKNNFGVLYIAPKMSLNLWIAPQVLFANAAK